jgi:non-ribosomal peptide synthetase component F
MATNVFRRETPDHGHNLRPGLNSTGSTITGKRFVAFGASGDPPLITLPANNTTAIIYGLLRADLPTGEVGSVMTGGKGVATAGTGGVTKFTRLTVEAATGKVVAWAPSADDNAVFVGTAMQDALVDEDVEVLINPTAAIAQG